VKIGYRGFYSFEWEKRWHPDYCRARGCDRPVRHRGGRVSPRRGSTVRCRRASRSSCCCLLRFRRPPSGARWNLIAGGAFHLGDVSGAQAVAFDDSGWRRLDVPHDWSIEGAFSDTNPAGANGGALPGGVGWYRKAFAVSQSDTGRLVFVEFDGVYRKQPGLDQRPVPGEAAVRV